MKKNSALKRVLKRTGTARMLISFSLTMCIVALIIMFIEPEINTFGDALWYCYVSATTIGFGDICVKTGFAKILTVFISVYGIMTVAMIPGIIVSYYLENNYLIFKIKNNAASLSEEKLKEKLQKPAGGYGLYNIKERIRLYYDDPNCNIISQVTEDSMICFTVRLSKHLKSVDLEQDSFLINR